MKHLPHILICLALLAVIYFGFLNRGKTEQADDAVVNLPVSSTKSVWESKTDEEGEVTVKVTPQALDGGEWKFDVVLDTHSTELSQDMIQATILVDDKGNEYRPVKWEGAGPGGHHREGVLVFQPVSPTPGSVELKIKDVGGIPERSFEWTLK